MSSEEKQLAITFDTAIADVAYKFKSSTPVQGYQLESRSLVHFADETTLVHHQDSDKQTNSGSSDQPEEEPQTKVDGESVYVVENVFVLPIRGSCRISPTWLLMFL